MLVNDGVWSEETYEETNEELLYNMISLYTL